MIDAEATLHLERVLTNLVGNAFRYTEQGVVKIVSAIQETEVVLSVHDSGEGIPESVLIGLQSTGALTEVLARGASSSGWGIGLHSVIAAANVLGGRIQFGRSACGGAAVDVCLPRGLFTERRDGVQQKRVADGGTFGSVVQDEAVQDAVVQDAVLLDAVLVDDDPEQSVSLKRALSVYGIECIPAQTIKEAIEIIRERRPRVVLCDSRMPDGGALALLESLDRSSDVPRMAVVSGDATEECVYKCASKGAEAFFSKPVEAAQIADWIKGEMQIAAPQD